MRVEINKTLVHPNTYVRKNNFSKNDKMAAEPMSLNPPGREYFINYISPSISFCGARAKNYFKEDPYGWDIIPFNAAKIKTLGPESLKDGMLNLSEMIYPSANFKEANIQNVDFSNSNLRELIMTGELTNINFHKCNLQNSRFYSFWSSAQGSHIDFSCANLSGANFGDSKWEYINLQNANLTGTKLTSMSYANIMGADFSNPVMFPNPVRFYGITVYDDKTKFPRRLEKGDFKHLVKFEEGADLRDAYLKGTKVCSDTPGEYLNYKNMSFINANLENCEYRNINFSNSKYMGTILNSSQFNGCILKNACFAETIANGVSFQDSDLSGSEFIYGGDEVPAASVMPPGGWELGKFLNKISGKERAARTHTMEKSNFINSDLSDTNIFDLPDDKLKNCLFSDGTILPNGITPEYAVKKGWIYLAKNCDMSDKDLSGTPIENFDFSRLQIKNFENSDFSRVKFTDCIFDKSNLSNCNFTCANLKGSSFAGCDLRECNFKNAVLKNVDLRGANLTKANLCGVDLSQSEIDETTIIKDVIYDNNTKLPKNLAFERSDKCVATEFYKGEN